MAEAKMAPNIRNLKTLVALTAMTAALAWTPAAAQDIEREELAPLTQQQPLDAQSDPGSQQQGQAQSGDQLDDQTQNQLQNQPQSPPLGQDIEQPSGDLGQAPENYEDRIENKVAEFYGIDKITGRIITFDVYINETVRFGALHVTPRVCYSRPPSETPKTTTFVEVDEITLDRQIRRIFTGWMFADSPGLNAIEHPVYDIWLKECKMTSDEAPPPS